MPTSLIDGPSSRSPELILPERVDMFAERVGCEHFEQRKNGQPFHVFVVRPEPGFGLGEVDLEPLNLEGRRMAKVTKDRKSLILLVQDEDVYDDDLAAVEAAIAMTQGASEWRRYQETQTAHLMEEDKRRRAACVEEVRRQRKFRRRSEVASTDAADTQSQHQPLRREDFSVEELRFVDQIWLPTEEMQVPPGLSKNSIQTEITNMLRPLRLVNRAELLVLGLKDGFLEVDLSRWRQEWPPLSPTQQAVLVRAHWPTDELASELDITEDAVLDAFHRCYDRTGLRTRAELLLGALANDVCTLEDLRTPEQKIRFSDLEEEMLSMIDLPYATISEYTGASKTTISNRYQRICETLGVKTREEAAVYAFREGYIENTIDPALAEIFTPRQRQVAALALLDNESIAEELGISRSVVDYHMTEAQKRVGVIWRPALVAYGLRAGLIDATSVRFELASRGDLQIKPHA